MHSIIATPADGARLRVVGDVVRVLAASHDTGGAYEIFEMEGTEGNGPPPHSHPWTEAYVVVEGEADVFVDGERWPAGSGQERLLVQLAPGRHHVEVRKSGYRGYLTEVTVSSGETLPLNVALTKE
jgi:quercetin dioxygenase-like cupin family protein